MKAAPLLHTVKFSNYQLPTLVRTQYPLIATMCPLSALNQETLRILETAKAISHIEVRTHLEDPETFKQDPQLSAVIKAAKSLLKHKAGRKASLTVYHECRNASSYSRWVKAIALD